MVTLNCQATTVPPTWELRCGCCGKLLAEKAAKGTVVVCSRCKTRNEVK